MHIAAAKGISVGAGRCKKTKPTLGIAVIGCLSLLSELVDYRADVNAVNNEGCTPLMFAAQHASCACFVLFCLFVD
jgi:hypothetical protein